MNDLVTQNRTKAIALWVQGEAYRMVIAGMTQREIAQVITEMGRGLRPGRLEGVEYPPDYRISQQAVTLAFRRYCQRNPVPGIAEMRRIDTQRCDDIYRAMAIGGMKTASLLDRRGISLAKCDAHNLGITLDYVGALAL